MCVCVCTAYLHSTCLPVVSLIVSISFNLMWNVLKSVLISLIWNLHVLVPPTCTYRSCGVYCDIISAQQANEICPILRTDDIVVS